MPAAPAPAPRTSAPWSPPSRTSSAAGSSSAGPPASSSTSPGQCSDRASTAATRRSPPLGRGTRPPCCPATTWHACLTQDAATTAAIGDLLELGALILTDADPDQLGLGAALIDRISSPCTTHIGASFGLAPSNRPTHLGETTGPIELHTDMAYRQVPPTLQVIHCIQAAADGGETLLADANVVAARLGRDARRRLMTSPVVFGATSDDVHLQGRHRVLQASDATGVATVFNRRKLVLAPADPVELWSAFDELDAVLAAPDLPLRTPLGRGEILVFDNQRILHGRTAFSDPRRQLVGWYGHTEDARSRLRVLAR